MILSRISSLTRSIPPTSAKVVFGRSISAPGTPERRGTSVSMPAASSSAAGAGPATGAPSRSASAGSATPASASTACLYWNDARSGSPAASRTTSEKLRGEGEAEATNLYAKAFNQDPNFFAIWRTLQGYRDAFDKGNARLVLTPDNDYLRYLQAQPAP